ncbi:uracil-DNA glycosylase [Pseudoalteromonas piscicida]|uniref:uracil-DNA glycosylase n=1 Tax=Pseudoalteromonas piscicida TaxID=43662 RepID=UPI0030C9BB92
MSVERFVRELCLLQFENAFNPYSDICEVYDYYDAPKKRRLLLKRMLQEASQVKVDSIWIGRDLGYRGGRRTGLALTDDVHLVNHASRWGIECGKLTKGDAVSERTAAVIWSILSQISASVFLWNVFPLHPYEEGAPFSNRTHNPKERAAGEEILEALIELLEPKRLVAVGNDAERTAKKLAGGKEVIKVRHPSYGGHNTFISQMKSLYNL